MAEQLTDHARNERLAETIRRFWRARGVVVDVRLEVLGSNKTLATCIRSNLVRGLPPQADQEVSDATAP